MKPVPEVVFTPEELAATERQVREITGHTLLEVTAHSARARQRPGARLLGKLTKRQGKAPDLRLRNERDAYLLAHYAEQGVAACAAHLGMPSTYLQEYVGKARKRGVAIPRLRQAPRSKRAGAGGMGVAVVS